MALDVTTGGKRRGLKPEINVTPLVDVVLVLLIIFMLITPLLGKQFWIHYPDLQQEQESKPAPDDQGPVVLSVTADGRARINREFVGDDDLSARVRRILAARGSRTIFFDAADEAEFGRAVEIMDIARAGGATTIAVLTQQISGQ